jgi:hypothetical protein
VKRSTYTPAKGLAAEQANAVQLEIAGIVVKPHRAPPRRSLEQAQAGQDSRGASAIELHAKRGGRCEAPLYYLSEGGEILLTVFRGLHPSAAASIREVSKPDLANAAVRAHALPRALPRAERQYAGDPGAFQGPVYQVREVVFPSERSGLTREELREKLGV